MDFYDLSFGRCGAPLHGLKLRLVDWEEGGYTALDKPNPRGELLFGGPAIAQGYFNLENETNEAFFVEDGIRWFRSGDIGEIFPDGTVKIIDRKKDLIKLLNGEYISLGKVSTVLDRYRSNLFLHVSFYCAKLHSSNGPLHFSKHCSSKLHFTKLVKVPKHTFYFGRAFYLIKHRCAEVQVKVQKGFKCKKSH